MMRAILLVVVCGTVLPTVTAAQRRAAPASWLSPCEVEGGHPAWCGTYDVWEDRAARAGRRIGLKVIVLPALGERPAPDAFVYLIGGPGAPATRAARGMAGWEAVRRDRDILLVDQRGTGGSNALSCGPVDRDRPLQEFFLEMFPEGYVDRCLARVREHADPRLYTTPIAADDLDEVREALGYEQLNLFGGSYGTRAALIYLRRHAAHVRTAILEGVAPTDMKNPLPFARALERGVQATIAACAAEPACTAAYPDLAGDWRRVTRMLEPGHVRAAVTDPRTGKQVEITIPRGIVADGIRHILYTVRDAARLPAMLHAAAAGDFSPFVAEEVEQSLGFADLLSYGMFLTVTCAEDVQFITEEDIARETRGTFLGDYRIREQQAACARWPRAGIGREYLEPVRVPTPVLIISGEVDTATPWEGGEAVARQLPGATHLLVPNQSHGSANPSCTNRIVLEFLRAGTMEGIDTSCVAETKRPPFAVSMP